MVTFNQEDKIFFADIASLADSRPSMRAALIGLKDRLMSLCTAPFGVHIGLLCCLLFEIKGVSDIVEEDPVLIERKILSGYLSQVSVGFKSRFYPVATAKLNPSTSPMLAEEKEDWIRVLTAPGAGTVAVSTLLIPWAERLNHAIRAGLLVEQDGKISVMTPVAHQIACEAILHRAINNPGTLQELLS